MANTEIINALSLQDSNGMPSEANLDAFKNAIGYGTFGNSEAREQLVQTAIKVNSASVSDTLKNDFYSYAHEQILLQTQESNGDARYEVFAGMLFSIYDDNTDALAHYQKAHELSPKKQTIDFYLIGAELNAGEKEKAVALAKEAYESAPEFNDAVTTYAATLIQTGKSQDGEKLLMKRFRTDLVDNGNLINAYYFNKQYDKVIAILKQKLTAGADEGTQLRLAAAYYESGDSANAILEIQKVEAQDPKFKTQGDAYIKEIQARK